MFACEKHASSRLVITLAAPRDGTKVMGPSRLLRSSYNSMPLPTRQRRERWPSLAAGAHCWALHCARTISCSG